MKLIKTTCYLMAVLMCIACFAGCGETVKDVPVDTIYKNIESAYGEDFLATTDMPKDMFDSEFGIDSTLIDSTYKASMPMIGAHPDRLVVVKATDSNNATKVEEAFNKAKQTKIDDTMQYPMNLAKINSTQVIRKGNYVAFILLGAIDDRENVSEADSLTFAKEQVQKGVNAFNKSFE